MNYLFQVLLWQALFYLLYLLFLKNETFFQLNRSYLLSAVIMSFVLPWIDINPDILSQNGFFQKLEPVIIGGQDLQNTLNGPVFSRIFIIYFAGISIMTAITFFNFYKLFKFYKLYPKERYKQACIIKIPLLGNAFSFLRYIFIDEGLNKNIQEKILLHEYIHVQQKHSWDILLFQTAKIVLWFNPFIYLLEKEIKKVHEFIADKNVIERFDKKSYLELLLQSQFKTFDLSFVHSFHKPSLIKKRIKMQNKNSSSKIYYGKYILILLFISAAGILINACKKTEDPVLKKTEILLIKKDKAPAKMYINTKDEDIEVAFQFIKNPPQIEGCEGLTGEEAKKCFSKKISEYISATFNTALANKIKIENPKVKILTQFTINKEGKITNIKARSRYKIFEEEAKRSIATLPRMKPAKQNGELVDVTYTLPIIFKVK